MAPQSFFVAGALSTSTLLRCLGWYDDFRTAILAVNHRCSAGSWLLLRLHCAVLAHQSSCGVLWAVSELRRVSWLRWPPLWLVCAPQHVSTIGCPLPPPASGSHPPLSPSSLSFCTFLFLALPSLHLLQALSLCHSFWVHFNLSSSPKTCMAMTPWRVTGRQTLGLIWLQFADFLEDPPSLQPCPQWQGIFFSQNSTRPLNYMLGIYVISIL